MGVRALLGSLGGGIGGSRAVALSGNIWFGRHGCVVVVVIVVVVVVVVGGSCCSRAVNIYKIDKDLSILHMSQHVCQE